MVHWFAPHVTIYNHCKGVGSFQTPFRFGFNLDSKVLQSQKTVEGKPPVGFSNRPIPTKNGPMWPVIA
jgi:hypothetical protein